MHKLEAIKILETKLAAIEQEYHAEFAGNEDMRDQADAKAEAKALAALEEDKAYEGAGGGGKLKIVPYTVRQLFFGDMREDDVAGLYDGPSPVLTPRPKEIPAWKSKAMVCWWIAGLTLTVGLSPARLSSEAPVKRGMSDAELKAVTARIKKLTARVKPSKSC